MARRSWLAQRLSGLLIILMFFLLASPGCADQLDRVRGGWYPWKPYQFLEHSRDGRDLSGLDVSLFREIFEQELGKAWNYPKSIGMFINCNCNAVRLMLLVKRSRRTNAAAMHFSRVHIAQKISSWWLVDIIRQLAPY